MEEPQSPKKTYFIAILRGDNVENEAYNDNDRSHTKSNARN